jgi:hypothetical protein
LELNLGDRLSGDLRLNVCALELNGIDVAAERINARVDRFGASTPISSSVPRKFGDVFFMRHGAR